MENKEKTTEKPTALVCIVALMWIIQSFLRFVFGYLNATTPGGLLDVEVSSTTIQVISMMFFLLGILGFIAGFGLLLMRRWGLWITIMVSILTILFDVWGATIQLTAAIGLIVPAITLVVIFAIRTKISKS
ncbi:MAG: DUF2127 domain-containing protein [Methanomassiliicoccales archaeon]|jgi:uncharacterized membrane protein (DUF2068 family)|nr:DUF2127 domain-containing protein [Methanomassiliicoccales archaeon]